MPAGGGSVDGCGRRVAGAVHGPGRGRRARRSPPCSPTGRPVRVHRARRGARRHAAAAAATPLPPPARAPRRWLPARPGDLARYRARRVLVRRDRPLPASPPPRRAAHRGCGSEVGGRWAAAYGAPDARCSRPRARLVSPPGDGPARCPAARLRVPDAPRPMHGRPASGPDFRTPKLACEYGVGFLPGRASLRCAAGLRLVANDRLPRPETRAHAGPYGWSRESPTLEVNNARLRTGPDRGKDLLLDLHDDVGRDLDTDCHARGSGRRNRGLPPVQHRGRPGLGLVHGQAAARPRGWAVNGTPGSVARCTAFFWRARTPRPVHDLTLPCC